MENLKTTYYGVKSMSSEDESMETQEGQTHEWDQENFEAPTILKDQNQAVHPVSQGGPNETGTGSQVRNRNLVCPLVSLISSSLLNQSVQWHHKCMYDSSWEMTNYSFSHIRVPVLGLQVLELFGYEEGRREEWLHLKWSFSSLEVCMVTSRDFM